MRLFHAPKYKHNKPGQHETENMKESQRGKTLYISKEKWKSHYYRTLMDGPGLTAKEEALLDTG